MKSVPFQLRLDTAYDAFHQVINSLEPGPKRADLLQDLEALTAKVEAYAAEPAST